MKLTDKQLHIIQHSLGCDEYGRGTMYRNRFVTGPSEDDFSDFKVCKELVAAGLMYDSGPQPMAGNMHYFEVLQLGIRLMQEQSPKPPRLTRSQKRYQRFLEGSGNMKFGQWLKCSPN